MPTKSFESKGAKKGQPFSRMAAFDSPYDVKVGQELAVTLTLENGATREERFRVLKDIRVCGAMDQTLVVEVAGQPRKANKSELERL